MNRSKTGKWARRVVWGTLAAIMAIGCSPLQLAGFIFGRSEKIPAQYPLTFAKDGPKKDKDEVVVLLLPYLKPGTSPEFITADRELAEKIAKILPDMTKENKDKLKYRVISPTQVDKFKITNPHWKQMTAGEIGEKLKADFVLEIEMAQMRLYQPNTPISEKIYEGRAEISVNIYEIGTNNSELKDQYPLSFSYPKGMPRSATAITERQFRQQYIDNLALAITQMHVEHQATDNIASGR